MKCEKTGRWTILIPKADGVTCGQWCTGCQDWHIPDDENKIIPIDEMKLCPMCRQELQKTRK